MSNLCDRLYAAADQLDPPNERYNEWADGPANLIVRNKAANLRHLADLAREHCPASLVVKKKGDGLPSAEPDRAFMPSFIPAVLAPPDWWALPELRIEFPRETLRRIIAEVAAKHSIPEIALIDKSIRARHVSTARQEAMWRVRNETGMSFTQIGRRFGGMDHSSAVHGVKKHQWRLDNGEAP